MIRYAFIADDFTGAIDALWQFQRFGLRAALIVDAGDLAHLPDGVDVVGIATTLRSLPADEIEAQSTALLDALVATGAELIQYKVCSTFDSSPNIGSIGRVIDVARRRSDLRGVFPVMPAQPELGRYTVFGHHFARASDGRIHRIDQHPVMRRHPTTPAEESRLVDVLGRQSSANIAEVATALLTDDEVRARLRMAEAGEADAVVLDATNEADAIRLGGVLREWLAESAAPVFAVGSGGLGWAISHAVTGAEPARPEPAPPADGAILALSGSRSSVTATQIDAAEQAGWLVLGLLDDEPGALAQASAAVAEGRNVVLYASRGAADGERAVSDVGERLARAARACLDASALSRLVIMGGDTSGEVLKELGVTAIELRAMMPPAMPLCAVTSTDPRVERLEVAVKGGQLGDVDYLVVQAGAQ